MRQPSTVLEFPARESLMRYPVGVPASLDTEPIIIDGAADAVALLAGLQWDAMTPTQRETARAFATLAAVALHPDGLLFLGYSIHRVVGFQATDQPPQHRSREVAEIIGALVGAAQRVIGVSNPKTTEAMVQLMQHDAKAKAERVSRGGW